MRHQKLVRQQIHSLEKGQRKLRHELKHLKTHNIDQRLGSLEKEQRRLANVNFNLSREVASLDQLHSSMLELLEDVEGIQTKFDKTVPDVRREISKLEFNFAQLNSEQSLLREEGRNRGKSIQAIAVSVSTLQEDRDIIKKLQENTLKIDKEFERIQTERRQDVHHRIEQVNPIHQTSFSWRQHSHSEIKLKYGNKNYSFPWKWCTIGEIVSRRANPTSFMEIGSEFSPTIPRLIP